MPSHYITLTRVRTFSFMPNITEHVVVNAVTNLPVKNSDGNDMVFHDQAEANRWAERLNGTAS